MRTRHIAPLAVLLAALAFSSGCAKTLTPNHPNQINTWDGAAYDTLIMAQASLGRCVQEVEAHPVEYGQYKEPLNKAIAAYNAAQAAYKVYHTAGNAAAPTGAIQVQIADVAAQVGHLLVALGVKI